MAAGATYEPIATNTLGSAAASVTFSSIPQGYTDLVLVIAGINSSGGSDACVLQLGNSSIDTATNYSTTYLYGVGSGSGSSGRQSNANFIQPDRSNSANQTSSVLQIQNYSNSTTYKTVISRSNNGSWGLDLFASVWRSTSSIDSIKVYPASGNMAIGSTFTLYGIKAA